jgi:biopolymer transport protein ExbD
MVLNEQVASMEMLLGNFQRATLKQKEMLIIQSGRRVLHDQIVKVMDLAKRADVKKIGFAMMAR